jgi:antitoxin ParD1/3/4
MPEIGTGGKRASRRVRTSRHSDLLSSKRPASAHRAERRFARLGEDRWASTLEYQNASEAVRDALRVLQQRRREDRLRLKALRAQIKAGTDALEQGDFAEIDDVDLEGYLERLTTPAAERAR